ncbi:immunoglobulin-like domain-containing protein [Indiicoccus explosivorum]|uniref:immunoglobulin-like domain-containing protein n=1 Tax=Indiicoccus explosivorum TaxID=1917864 RepID=UPI000B4347C8|nr:immunoglobulin-like domain-containing protein [Indiicoccus explosivorum]
MKKQLLMYLVLLAACSQPGPPTLPDPVPEQRMDAAEAGLSAALSEDAFTGSPPVITVRLTNGSGKPYEYGGYFSIEVLKDGAWHALDHSDAIFFTDPGFRDTGEVLAPGAETSQPLSVESLGVTLTPGDYRLVKTFMPMEEPFHEVSVAVPFSVE